MNRKEFDDYHVAFRPDQMIENLVDKCRFEAGITDSNMPILEMFKLLIKNCFGEQAIPINSCADFDMGNKFGYAQFDPPRIYLRESLLADAESNVPLARFAVLHELAHIMLDHRGVGEPKALTETGPRSVPYITPENSAEHQADLFARAMLLPRNEMKLLTLPEIGLRYLVPYRVAQERFREINPELSRKTPTHIKEYLLSVKKTKSRPTLKLVKPKPQIIVVANPLDAAAEKAWNEALVIDDEDPDVVRKTRGGTEYRICKIDFGNATSEEGWIVEHGRAIALMDKLSR